MARTTKNRQEQKSKGNKKNKTADTKKEIKPAIDYTVKCLLLPIKKGDVIKVDSETTFTGDLKVMAIDITDFEMTLKTKVLNEVTK